MKRFRYPQFCAIARAAEILGERWTLLIVRELFIGPQRFSDLRRRLSDVSTSVLAERLAHLESLGIVARRELEPPAASTVYELAEHGRALEPVLAELVRWGARFLLPPRSGDRLEPDWLATALVWFARRTATPANTYELRMVDGGRETSVFVSGGRRGTRVDREPRQVDVVIAGEPLAIVGIASGFLDWREARAGGVHIEGDTSKLAELPALFEMPSESSPRSPTDPQPNSKGE